MIKRCGNYRTWHFAHKTKQCDYDKYLHTVAEQKILEWFNSSSDVKIDICSFSKCLYSDKCRWKDDEDPVLKEFKDLSLDEFEDYGCKKKIVNRYNLKEWFNYGELEKSYVKNGRRYVADIYCHRKKSNGEPLFLEICVTHRCELEKINSGIRIIEFDISSEEDIDTIINSPIKESEYIHLYNFHPKESISNEVFRGIKLKKVVLYPSLKTSLYYLSCSEIDKRRGIFEITAYELYANQYFLDYKGFYHVAIAVASRYIPFKSCYLCKYHELNKWGGGYICTLYKSYGKQKFCRDNNPLECSQFLRDEDAINKRITAMNEYMKSHPVDIWIHPQYTDKGR